MSFSHQVLQLSPLWLEPGEEAYTKPPRHRLPVLMHILEYRGEKGEENTKIKEKNNKVVSDFCKENLTCQRGDGNRFGKEVVMECTLNSCSSFYVAFLYGNMCW